MFPLLKFVIVLPLLSPTLALENWDDILNDDFDTSNWINPNDMGFDLGDQDAAGHLKKEGDLPKPQVAEDGDTKVEKPVVKNEDSGKTKTTASSECSIQTSIEETFTLRRVRQLLKVLKLDEDADADVNDATRRFDAKLELSAAQIRKLRQFSNVPATSRMSHKERLGLLHDVDAVFNGLILDATPEKEFDFADLAEDYTTLLKRYLPSSQDLFWGILIGGGLSLAYFLWIGLPLWKWLLILIAMSSLWHWGHLYKKVLLKKQLALMSSSQIPQECFKQNSWFDFFSRGSQKCAEYHDALLVDPLWEVTPTMAVAETLTLMLVQPLEAVGLHMGKFFSSLLANLSWLSALPVLVFVFLLIVLLSVMLFGYKIRLPFLLASIEPHAKVDHQAAKQVIMLEQKVEELQRKLEHKAETAPTLREPERMALTVAASSVETLAAEAVQVEPQSEEVLSYKLKLEELERKADALSTTFKSFEQLTLSQANEPAAAATVAAASEVVTLQAAVEVLPENCPEAEVLPILGIRGASLASSVATIGSSETTEVCEQVEETKESSQEDFEWVSPASTTAVA